MNMPDMPLERIWRRGRRVYPWEISNVTVPAGRRPAREPPPSVVAPQDGGHPALVLEYLDHVVEARYRDVVDHQLEDDPPPGLGLDVAAQGLSFEQRTRVRDVCAGLRLHPPGRARERRIGLVVRHHGEGAVHPQDGEAVEVRGEGGAPAHRGEHARDRSIQRSGLAAAGAVEEAVFGGRYPVAGSEDV